MKVLSLLLLLTALFACNRPEQAPQTRPPNIILIITDDQGYGDVGFHGNPFIRTPVLDSLAGMSTRIDPFYVSPVCAPTRSSLMTGRYHLRTGVYDTYNGGAMMATGEVTVAEVLAENGYHTAMIGKWHLGDNYPMRPGDQGFKYSLAHRGGGIGQPGDDFGNFVRRDSSYFNPYLWENGTRIRKQGYCSDIFTDEAIRYVRQRSRDSDGHPFFLYLSYNAPHTPLQLPESYEEAYRDMTYGPGDFRQTGAGLPEMTDRDLEDARKVYGMVSNIDDNLGKLWKTLDDLEIEEHTLVVFLTDNGPQQRRYTAGLNGRKGSVLEGGIRVPCFFRWKGELRENRTIQFPAAHIDLMPTLLEFAGIRYKGEMDGISLVPWLRGSGDPPADRPLFFVWERGYPQRYSNMAVRKGPFKLVGQTEHGEPTDSLRLFNLLEDPFEISDVGLNQPEIKTDLLQELDSWYGEIIRSPNLVDPPRIVVGSASENPVILGRNDWKGPVAARWGAADAFGYWDIHVARPGTWAVKMVFLDRLPGGGKATIRVGTRQYALTPRDTLFNEVILDGLTFDPGDHSLEAWYRAGGSLFSPIYVQIEHSIPSLINPAP